MTFLWIDRDGYFMLLLTKYTVLYKENEICCIILLSLPSRERGLKSSRAPTFPWRKLVAPFAGAWIEIKIFVTKFRSPWCRSLRGSVDWNLRDHGIDPFKYRRSLRGSVDWNCKSRWHGGKCQRVAPFAGAWIEMSWVSTYQKCHSKSLPSRERGLK